jgi:hypothetical protein
MPRGPKGERRPANVNARAVLIARIATGEIDDAPPRMQLRVAIDARDARKRESRAVVSPYRSPASAVISGPKKRTDHSARGGQNVSRNILQGARGWKVSRV